MNKLLSNFILKGYRRICTRLLTMVTHVKKTEVGTGNGEMIKGNFLFFYFDHLNFVIAKIYLSITCLILKYFKRIKYRVKSI